MNEIKLALDALKRLLEVSPWPAEDATTSDGCYSDDPVEKQTREAIAALEAVQVVKDRCEHCGTKLSNYPVGGCPECGAPICCQKCCKEAVQVEPVGMFEIWTDGTSGYPQYDLAIKPETVASLGDGGHAVFATPQQPAPGWQWVPIEPTPEMILAYTKCRTRAGESWARHQYKAMLAAAPKETT